MSGEPIDGVVRWRIDADGARGVVPGWLLRPDGIGGKLPVVLFGHGGGAGKDGPWNWSRAVQYAIGVPAAVVVIDAPAHGERAPQVGTPIENFRAQRRSLRDPEVIEQIVVDWRASIEKASTLSDVDVDRMGYAGFSQGALYGVSTVAELGGISGAVFGIGGLPRSGGVSALARQMGFDEETAKIMEEEDDSEFRSRVVLEAAGKLHDTEVLALQMTGDEVFPLEGSLELFAAYPARKRMALWEGGHIEIPSEAIELSIAFLRRTVAGSESSLGVW
jgi:dienelactone hydrolase